MPRLLVPETISWTLPDLPLEVARYRPSEPMPAGALEADAMLVWGVPRGVLHTLIDTMPNLRWVQTLTAGVDHVMSARLPERVVVCNGKGLHDAPTAEMAVALLLSAARGLHVFRDRQKRSEWDRSAYNEQLENTAPRLGTLEGARVLILGMGTIGLDIAHKLRPFGCQTEGVAMSAGTREGFKVHALEDLDELLPRVDALIMVLPDTPATHGILSRERIARLNPRAWVVNVGRGSAIDEPALIEALEQHRIEGAALDVTSREPLQSDSRLWSLENLILTPHVAGGGPRFYQKANDLIVRNTNRFVRGEALENMVSREKGY
jgi:phosphoglycerate dehydrogenase-like enzyme